MEDEGDDTDAREMQSEGRAASLLEEHEKSDQQINEADEFEIKIVLSPTRLRVKAVEVCVVKARHRRVRRAFIIICQMPADARFFKEDLHLCRA